MSRIFDTTIPGDRLHDDRPMPLAAFYAYSPEEVACLARATDMRVAAAEFNERLRSLCKYSNDGNDAAYHRVRNEWFDIIGDLLD